jgi:secreted trypsin-like serine protease
MGSRALTATALTFALLLGALTPALGQDRAAPAAPAQATIGKGGLTPLGEPGEFTLSAEPRTGADVIGGSTVGRYSHKFVALIQFYDDQGEVLGECTGTLIRRRWVLTAAHCVAGSSGANVALRTTRIADLEPRNIFAADAAAIAPTYKPTLGRNDLGLLRLKKAVRINPIRLAGASDDTRLAAGTKAKILGWGIDDTGTLTDRLLQGRVELWGSRECRGLFGSLWRGGRMLCGGSVTTDVCYGDSGGPLLVRRGDRWLQHGVTSFGDSECATGDASVYTRVSALRPWIERVTGLPQRR